MERRAIHVARVLALALVTTLAGKVWGQAAEIVPQAAIGRGEALKKNALWSVEVDVDAHDPILAGGKVLLGHGKNGITAIYARTGKPAWSWKSKMAGGQDLIRLTVSAADDLVLANVGNYQFGDKNNVHQITALSLSEGKELWHVDMSPHRAGAGVSSAGVVVFSSLSDERPAAAKQGPVPVYDQMMRLLDKTTGKELWNVDLYRSELLDVAVNGNAIYVNGRHPSSSGRLLTTLRKYDARDGKMMWSYGLAQGARPRLSADAMWMIPGEGTRSLADLGKEKIPQRPAEGGFRSDVMGPTTAHMAGGDVAVVWSVFSDGMQGMNAKTGANLWTASPAMPAAMEAHRATTTIWSLIGEDGGEKIKVMVRKGTMAAIILIDSRTGRQTASRVLFTNIAADETWSQLQYAVGGEYLAINSRVGLALVNRETGEMQYALLPGAGLTTGRPLIDDGVVYLLEADVWKIGAAMPEGNGEKKGRLRAVPLR